MPSNTVASWKPKDLALHIEAVLQGSFILAKATGDPSVALDSISHLRRYVETLLPPVELA